MKKVMCILLAAMPMIGLQTAANSATLQAGWYVDIFGVQLSFLNGPDILDGHFTSLVGTYGPFQVTDPTSPDNEARIVTVPSTTAASSADSLALPFTFGGGFTNAVMSFACYTDYDPSQMHASLWSAPSEGDPVCIWSQMEGGAQGGGSLGIFQATVSPSYYFLVTVVPEPSGIAVLLVGILAVGFCASRRVGSLRLALIPVLLATFSGPTLASLLPGDVAVIYNCAGPTDLYQIGRQARQCAMRTWRPGA